MNDNLLILLEHCSNCDLISTCCFPNREECKQMKTLLAHFASCELFPCVICKDMTDLTKLHSSNCQSIRCKVEKCNIIRHSMMCSRESKEFLSQPRILKIVSDLPIEQNTIIKSNLSIATSSNLQDQKKSTVYHCSKCRQPKNLGHKCTMLVSPEKKENKKRKIDDEVFDARINGNFDVRINDDIITLPNRCENSFKTVSQRDSEANRIYKSKHNKTRIAIEERKIRMIEKREDFIQKKMSATAKDVQKIPKIPRPCSRNSLTSVESVISDYPVVEEYNKIDLQAPTVTEEDNSCIQSACFTPTSILDDNSLFDSLSFDFSDSDDLNGIIFNENIFSD